VGEVGIVHGRNNPLPPVTLNLERGCIGHDRTTGLLLMRGKHWKGVRDPDGATRAQGEVRTDPWVVTAPVATAVAVLERLHPSRLLFPNTLLVNGRAGSASLRTRVDRGRNDSESNRDIAKLIAWIDAYCEADNRGDSIPPDPTRAAITASRLRRTLAWFIVRRPRGLIAAAIQYGHVRVAMTLGYSGS
jgi:hypothetical protein